MSGDRLREAAAQMRVDANVEYQRGHIVKRKWKTELAVADWLDWMAEKGERNLRPDLYLHGWQQALAVADAYLGSAS